MMKMMTMMGVLVMDQYIKGEIDLIEIVDGVTVNLIQMMRMMNKE